MVLAKNLSYAGYDLQSFEMVLVTADQAWHHTSRPLVDFGARKPVGVGDLTSDLLLVESAKGIEPAESAGARHRGGI